VLGDFTVNAGSCASGGGTLIGATIKGAGNITFGSGASNTTLDHAMLATTVESRSTSIKNGYGSAPCSPNNNSTAAAVRTMQRSRAGGCVGRVIVLAGSNA